MDKKIEKKLEYLLFFYHIKGVGLEWIKKINFYFDRLIESGDEFKIYDFINGFIKYFPERNPLLIFDKKSKIEIESFYFEKNNEYKNKYENIKIIHLNNNFPIVFLKGNENLLYNKKVAIVGTRKPLFSIKNYVFEFSKKLSEKNITIVSGLARGVDTMSHKGGLCNIGKTIAVIPCGINFCYPLSNRSLFEEIQSEGLIVSMFPIDYRVNKTSLVIRNKLIAELSNEIILAQSEINGGARYCIEYAEKNGKKIFNLTRNTGLGFSLNKKLFEKGYNIYVLN